MAQHNQLGKWGEEYAANFLLNKGYDILERDWRIGHRDIDIIARAPEGNIIVFVDTYKRCGYRPARCRRPTQDTQHRLCCKCLCQAT